VQVSFRRFAGFLLFCTLYFFPSDARLITISPNATSADCTQICTLSAALAFAEASDNILALPGVYSIAQLTNQTLVIDKNITLRAEDSTSVLDLTGSRGFRLSGEITLSGFTITSTEPLASVGTHCIALAHHIANTSCLNNCSCSATRPLLSVKGLGLVRQSSDIYW